MKRRPLHALVVDDDPAMRGRLCHVLEMQGYNVVELARGSAAVDTVRRGAHLDVILLEPSLPDIDGLSIIRELRLLGSSIPIIVISKCSDEAAIVEALDLGADDYLTKPFGTKELLARIRVSLRHRIGPEILKAGALTVNIGERSVWLADEKIHVSPTEYALLSLLMRNAGTVLTNSQIGRAIWGDDVDPQYVRVLVGSLRQKLKDQSIPRTYILSERGIGYRFGLFLEEFWGPDSKLSLKLANLEVMTGSEARPLLIDGNAHYLPPTDLSILKILLQHKGLVVPKKLIAGSIAQEASRITLSSIEVYIHRLRRQLKERGAKVVIDTVKGAGYLINECPENNHSNLV
jgi:two-component system KDP operon response regulator KdpE